MWCSVTAGWIYVTVSECFSFACLTEKETERKMSGTRTLCCHVNTATLSFAILYLIGNLLKLVHVFVTISWEKSNYSVSYRESNALKGQTVFDISSNIVSLILMSLSAVLVFFSRRKGPMFLLPFLLMMFAELILSFLSLVDGGWTLQGATTYRAVLQTVKDQKKVSKLNEEEIGQITMWCSVFFMLEVLLKVYVLQVSMKCYYTLKERKMAATLAGSGKTVAVKLPSYDEALQMKAEDTPPVYLQA